MGLLIELDMLRLKSVEILALMDWSAPLPMLQKAVRARLPAPHAAIRAATFV